MDLINNKNAYSKIIIILFLILELFSRVFSKLFIKDLKPSYPIKINKFNNSNNNLNNDSIIKNLTYFIDKLNQNIKFRKPKYILFLDNLLNEFCSDINAFILFEYFIKNNHTDAYYIVNINSDLYTSLLAQNKTKNVIFYEKKKSYYNLFEYFLNSKIIVASYVIDLIKIINEVSYLKFLFINHGISYFKISFVKPELRNLKIYKRNVISSSPFEYALLLEKFNYSEKYIYKAGLARYDMYNKPKINTTSKKCILIFFTFRNYNKTIFHNSQYKINIENLINDELFIKYLKQKEIDLIFAQHHEDTKFNKTYNISSHSYVKMVNHIHLTHYISQCSLLITDFSSVCFSFMFQLKPVLFYLIDYKDKVDSNEKRFMKENDTLYFGNYYLDKHHLLNKVEYYIMNNFTIPEKLKKQYESVFFYRYNITEKIYRIINRIIEKK